MDCDWRDNRIFILEGLRELQADVKELRGISTHNNALLMSIQSTLNKNSPPKSASQVKSMLDEGKKNGMWEPWKYTALGAGIAFGSNVLLEALKVVIR